MAMSRLNMLLAAAFIGMVCFVRMKTPNSQVLLGKEKSPGMKQFHMFCEVLARGLTGIMLKTPAYGPAEGTEAQLRKIRFNYEARSAGGDWPVYGVTMVGLKRLFANRDLILDIERRKIQGDIVEAGVWRGGSSIFMRGVLDYIGSDRNSWMFDSYAGLPLSTTDHDTDGWAKLRYVAVSLEEVKENFKMANISTEKVRFHKGFHCDTFPKIRNGSIPLKKIAILRLDSDMWEATMDILYHTWELLSVGGWIINDDDDLPAQTAIKDFADIHGFDFDEKMKIQIDSHSYYFQKTESMNVAVKYETYFRIEKM